MLNQIKKAIKPDSAFSAADQRLKMSAAMSRYAGPFRNVKGMAELEKELYNLLHDYYDNVSVSDVNGIPELLKARDIFIMQTAVLSAMRQAAEQVGSRGSALVTGDEGASIEGLNMKYKPNKKLPENMRMVTRRQVDCFSSVFEPVRPLPKPDGWFENVWNNYRMRTKHICCE